MLVRIKSVEVLDGFRVRLTLTDGRTEERDLESLLVGKVFDPIRNNVATFHQVRIDHGTLAWPGGIDLCPDMVIYGGPPPAESKAIPAKVAEARKPYGTR